MRERGKEREGDGEREIERERERERERGLVLGGYRGTSLIRNTPLLGRTLP